MKVKVERFDAKPTVGFDEIAYNKPFCYTWGGETRISVKLRINNEDFIYYYKSGSWNTAASVRRDLFNNFAYVDEMKIEVITQKEVE